jgi:hypothetical protein
MAKKTTSPGKGIRFNFRTIKSFEDACKKEKVDPEKLPDVSMIPEEFRKAIIAVYKLFIIFKAINNDWIVDFTNFSQIKYYPWLRVNSSGSGFDFSASLYHYGYAAALVGSRLCTDTSEKAIYISKQFGEEYAKFFLK